MARSWSARVSVILLASLMVFCTLYAGPVTMAASINPSFGPVKNLSNSPGISTAPVVAAVASHVYVAWEETPAGLHTLTYFTTSSDYGSHWAPLTAFSGLKGNANPQTSAVQIAAEGTYVFLTWKQGAAAAYAISSNYGATFNYNVFSLSSTLAGTMTGQAVSACGSNAYFTWADQLSSNDTRVILFVRAHDSGGGVFSFSTPKVLTAGIHTHGEDESACVGNYVYVVWDSIYATSSANNGATWTTPLNVRPPSGVSGTLSREPMISASGPNVYVTFPSNVGGSYQSYIVVSNNNGATFAPAKIISVGMTSTREVQVASAGNNVYVTTRGNMSGVGGTQQYVYVSTNAGATFVGPTLLGKLPNPQNGFGGLAVDGSRAYVQWIHRAVLGVNMPQQIFLAGSTDGGATWSGPQQVSNSATGTVGYGDPNGGQGPMVATSLGHVYVVWQDNDSGNGDIYFVAGS